MVFSQTKSDIYANETKINVSNTIVLPGMQTCQLCTILDTHPNVQVSEVIGSTGQYRNNYYIIILGS